VNTYATSDGAFPYPQTQYVAGLVGIDALYATSGIVKIHPDVESINGMVLTVTTVASPVVGLDFGQHEQHPEVASRK
jgi:hypothetical protein